MQAIFCENVIFMYISNQLRFSAVICCVLIVEVQSLFLNSFLTVPESYAYKCYCNNILVFRDSMVCNELVYFFVSFFNFLSTVNVGSFRCTAVSILNKNIISQLLDVMKDFKIVHSSTL